MPKTRQDAIDQMVYNDISVMNLCYRRAIYDGAYYTPIFTAYPETTFGGEFPTEADIAIPT